jgi:tRNA dimethylallyltransferase
MGRTATSISDAWYLTGPTASGKTTVGLALAERLGAEIISLDSMAVYRGLDIGTAKPSVAERRRVPHHLIDICDPAETFSVAQYLEAARRAVDDICSRGRQVLFVGGTPMYLKALLRGLFDGPPADWELRKRLLAEAERNGPRALHERLALVDPAAASRLHENDTRRVVRALEVFQSTGRSIIEWQTQWDAQAPDIEAIASGQVAPSRSPGAGGATVRASRVFVLDWPREQLYARIDARVQAMFEAGLIDEVRGLLAAGCSLGRTARQALGYREVLEHLEGQRDIPATIELVARRTRNFAKRQLTWFRGLNECQWVRVAEKLNADAVALTIVNLNKPPDVKPKPLQFRLRTLLLVLSLLTPCMIVLSAAVQKPKRAGAIAEQVVETGIIILSLLFFAFVGVLSVASMRRDWRQYRERKLDREEWVDDP